MRVYEEQGARIMAAGLPGWPTPPIVGNHIPDIMVEYLGRVVYSEIETHQTLAMPETRNILRESAERAALHLTVPASCLEVAKHLTSEWGVEVDAFWRYGE